MLTTKTEYCGFSVYHLMHNIPGIPSQRADRFNLIIEWMFEQKHIEICAKTPQTTLYRITEEGKNWYKELGKPMMKWAELKRT